MEENTEQTVKHIQKYILEIMKEFDRVCRKNDINYYMVAGTLLGSVRHKGFIPWDDDSDTVILRKDFKKLQEVCKTQLNPKFQLDVCCEGKDDFLPIMKIRFKKIFWTAPERKGLYLEHKFVVDIAAVDSFPESKKDQKKQARQLGFYNNLIYGKKHVPTYTKLKTNLRSLLAFFYPASVAHLKRRYQNIAQRFNDQNTPYVFITGSAYPYRKEIIARKYLEEPKEYVFEDTKLLSLSNPEEYLVTLYKDYMKLPPVEDRFGNRHETSDITFDFPDSHK